MSGSKLIKNFVEFLIMLKTRVIPTLLFKDHGLVKGKNLILIEV